MKTWHPAYKRPLIRGGNCPLVHDPRKGVQLYNTAHRLSLAWTNRVLREGVCAWPAPRVHALVLTHLPLMRERLGAKPTLERLFARVGSNVSLEDSLLREAHGAEFTPERSLAGVVAKVHNQTAPPREGLATQATLVWALACVRPLVIQHAGSVRCGKVTLEALPQASFRARVWKRRVLGAMICSKIRTTHSCQKKKKGEENENGTRQRGRAVLQGSAGCFVLGCECSKL